MTVSVSLYAAARPDHKWEYGYSAGSGDYGKKVQRFSADNTFKIMTNSTEGGDVEAADNSSELFSILTRFNYSDYKNSDKAILKQFNEAGIMLGVKAENNTIMGTLNSSHEYARNTFDDSIYYLSYVHTFKLGNGSEIETGPAITNKFHFGKYMKKHPMVPLPIPAFIYSTNVNDWAFKLGLVNLALWRNDKIMFQVMYIPVFKYSLSFRYNIFQFLYTELYTESIVNSVTSSKTDTGDTVNTFSINTGLRIGGYISRNISISCGGGYSPYSRDWLGSSTDINKGRRTGSSFSGEMKISIFF
jgi:hypothetical protein